MLVKLDVQETGAKRQQMNPGGQAQLGRLGGAGAGLPFYAFVDTQGHLIVNSNREGGPRQNIGYPGAPQEIDWFMRMVRKAAPTLSAGDAGVLESWLRAHAPR